MNAVTRPSAVFTGLLKATMAARRGHGVLSAAGVKVLDQLVQKHTRSSNLPFALLYFSFLMENYLKILPQNGGLAFF